jgi:hypothetical protein
MKLICCEFGDTAAIKIVSNLLWHRAQTFGSSFSSLPSQPKGSWVWQWRMTDGGKGGACCLLVAIVLPGQINAFLKEQGIARGQTVLVTSAHDCDEATGARLSVRFRTGAEPAALLHGTEMLSELQEELVIDQLLKSFVFGTETVASPGFVSRTLFFRGSDEDPEERTTN